MRKEKRSGYYESILIQRNVLFPVRRTKPTRKKSTETARRIKIFL